MGKVKITTWVNGETAGVLKGLAAQHGISMSEMCAERLRASVADGVKGVVPHPAYEALELS